MKVRQYSSAKPYHRCLLCERFRKVCGGMPTRGMDLQNWCEYMRDVKEMTHLTNADIAKEADVSVKTIERIMAINFEQDIMRSTARRIEQAIIGDVGKHFCELDHDESYERINNLLAEVDYWRKENEALKSKLDKMDELHRQDIRAVKSEYQEQILFMKDQLKAWQSRR